MKLILVLHLVISKKEVITESVNFNLEVKTVIHLFLEN